MANNFTLKFETAKVLKTLFEIVAPYNDEIKLQVDDSGLYINLMDPGRIVLMRIILPADAMEQIESKGNNEVCVNIDDLDKIFKRIPARDIVELSFKEGDQKLKILTKTRNKGNEEGIRPRTFTLANLNADIEDVEMGNLLTLNFPNQFYINLSFLEDILKDAKIYNEVIEFKINGDLTDLVIGNYGQIGEYSCVLNLTDLINPRFNAETTSAYSISYLQPLMKLKSIAGSFKVSLNSDKPIKTEAKLIDGGKVIAFQAPRVEEDFDAEEDKEQDEEQDEEQKEE